MHVPFSLSLFLLPPSLSETVTPEVFAKVFQKWLPTLKSSRPAEVKMSRTMPPAIKVNRNVTNSTGLRNNKLSLHKRLSVFENIFAKKIRGAFAEYSVVQ